MPKRRPFGTYGYNPGSMSPFYFDVADTQDLLPQGARIRNKKAKRRQANKKTRMLAAKQMRGDINDAIAAGY